MNTKPMTASQFKTLYPVNPMVQFLGLPVAERAAYRSFLVEITHLTIAELQELRTSEADALRVGIIDCELLARSYR